MKIIHPYGRSVVTTATTNRQIQVSKSDAHFTQDAPHAIEDFAEKNAALVLAQWVSIIDKIATKPRGKNKASQEQRDLREQLANAVWQRLAMRLQNDCSVTDMELWEKRWCFKVHPYETDTATKDSVDYKPNLKGKWYSRFVGDTEPTTLTAPDFQAIAERIEQHLYQQALRLGVDTLHSIGLIEKRAKSISENTLKYSPYAAKPWTEADEQQYFSRVDIASIIYQEAKAIYDLAEKDNQDKKYKKPPHIPLSIAAAKLYQHWKIVFGDLNATEAKVQQPTLLALHDAIKAAYTKILKEQRKKDKLAALPKNNTTLLNLVNNQYQNQDINELIRKGKILYYADSNTSRQTYYKTSDGQTEIKRAEAFVRVWRNVIGQANLTLSSWALMKQANLPANVRSQFPRDILASSNTHTVVNHAANFDTDLFDKNTALVFGNDADLFTNDDDLKKATIKSAISGMIALRNSAFHFKGLKTFLDKLFMLPTVDGFETQALDAPISTLWDRANNTRNQRLLAIMQGAHALHYFKYEQINNLISLLCDDHSSHIALPRFSRMLERHGNIQHRDQNGNVRTPKYGMPPLPPVANRSDLEQKPAQKCQYILLKLLYERAFRSWLENDSKPHEVERWIKTALDRATNAAKSLNADGNKDKRLLIQSRAENLPCFESGQNIRQFFDKLTAASASEMRIQRGYNSDAEAAREQAAYIDELLCDVVALAFKDFLSFENLRNLLELEHDQALPNTLCCSLDNLTVPTPTISAEPWQRVLFFLLYLIPVGEVSQLLHQLAKWYMSSIGTQFAEQEERLKALQYTLKLYLDIHDSQYSSLEADGKSMPKVERDQLAVFAEFYEHENVFNRAFPEQGTELGTQTYLPQRELREIRRFGHLPVLRALNATKISGKQVTDCIENETVPEGKPLSKIALAQQKREQLHQQWIKDKNKFKQHQSYVVALKTIIQHRQAVHHCYLINTVSAHRIVMKVLTRLTDFAGLFERDLNFALQSLLQKYAKNANDVFTTEGVDKFNDGQVISALTSKNTIQANYSWFLDELKQLIHYETKKDIRNHLAHFNMLQSTGINLNTPLNLTHWVNQTRELVAYDRKLKNAVSKSIIELMAREGFELSWEMNTDHKLCNTKIKSRTINHLGGSKLSLKDKLPNGKNKQITIKETLHSDEMVKILAQVFDATASSTDDITSLDLARVDWAKTK